MSAMKRSMLLCVCILFGWVVAFCLACGSGDLCEVSVALDCVCRCVNVFIS